MSLQSVPLLSFDLFPGYGNDSRQTGPLPSRSLHIAREAGFAFYVETRPQWLRRWGTTDPLILFTRPVFSAFSATFQSRGFISRKAYRVRVCRLIANRTPVMSGVGEMGISSVLVLR